MSRALGMRCAPHTPLPCRSDPDRWFDPHHRTTALQGCLQCPVRGWCAGEALRTNASWGMWAGIWIDDEAAGAAQHLRAVAENPPRPLELRFRPATPEYVPPQPFSVAPPAALIRARASGHCEVLLDGCRFTGDIVLSRLTGDGEPDPPTAAHGFLACDPCRTRLTEPARIAVDELGYRVPSPAAAAQVPFFWRQTRWVLLDPGGRLLDVGISAAHVRAS